ncbi:hypothetical protein D3877_12025 [Azospirillum cavernae]|uniref:Uncharacterized protein n=1 Tax=Azospirillum cavernae TaxID=2320860 RepID=A0A418VV05_9PROT|nr:hypothetical protein [Azospirillum cavernae]RJF80954.1 hypothetical protein D3877_12025 [Azospirillum cavernae]
MAYNAATGGGSTWTPEDDKVDSEVSRITSAGGPLMQQAKTDGLAGAQRRGLLNSSMAVGSSQAAVLNAALPMAAQNAAQTAQKNLSGQEYGQNRGLQEQKFGYDTALSDQGYRQNSALSDQDYRQNASLSDQGYRQNSVLSDQDYRQNQGLTQLKGGWDSRLQEEKSVQDKALSDRDFQQKKALLYDDNVSKEKIASWNVSQYEKDRATTALTAMEGLYANEFQNIAGNVNLPAEARNTYLQHIATLRDSTLSMVEQMYGINLTWASPATPNVA